MGAHQSHYNCKNFVSWKDPSKNQCGEKISDAGQNYARGIANNGVSPTCWVDNKSWNANDVYYKVNNQYYGQRTHGSRDRQPGDYILPVGGGNLPFCSDVKDWKLENSILAENAPIAGNATGAIDGDPHPGIATTFMRSDAAPALKAQKGITPDSKGSGYQTITVPTVDSKGQTSILVNTRGIIEQITSKSKK